MQRWWSRGDGGRLVQEAGSTLQSDRGTSTADATETLASNCLMPLKSFRLSTRSHQLLWQGLGNALYCSAYISSLSQSAFSSGISLNLVAV